MTPSRFFKTWGLGFKLNLILILVLAILLVIMLLILNRSMTNLTLRTGQRSVEEEITVIQSRFEGAKQEILTAAKLLATRPGLVEAVTNRDADTLWTISLTGRGALDLDYVDVVDTDGARLITTAEVIDGPAVDDLVALGLLGIEETKIVSDKQRQEPALLLAATVPLRDTSGAIVGALLAGREINDEFLTEINFSRDEVQLALIHDDQVVAQTGLRSINEHGSAEQSLPDADVRRVLDQTAVEMALSGQTVIVEEIVFFTDNQPRALAYTPLMIDGDGHTTLAISTKVGELVSFQRQLTVNMGVLFSFLTMLAVAAVTWFIWRKVAVPLGNLKTVAEQITAGDYSLQAKVTTTDEIGQLAQSFNQMTGNLRQMIEVEQQARTQIESTNKALEEQIWQSTGLAQLNDRMQGEHDIPSLATSIIQQLCHYLQAQIGALYIVEDHRLSLAGSYAYHNKTGRGCFKFGEGLVGQAALEKQPLIVTDVPTDYITVSSGLGETPPRNIAVFPFTFENRVMGVVELGTLGEFDPVQLNFIQVALDNIAITFNTAQARARIDQLLLKTQQQAEELQAQSEELRVANEELETQTESLRASEAKLKEKQAELEVTNAQLEEQAAALEENSRVLQDKQATLDRQNQTLKLAQQELQQKAEELARASKYKSEFLANMSHELRTPLNSLLILARMLADNEGGNLTDEQVESAQIIYSGGRDLLNLINDILDLSKVESGKMVFNFEPTPLADLLTTIQAQFGPVAEEKGLELNLTLADDLPATIKTDAQRVKQIIKNLLSNAFKFTNAGQVGLNIYRPAADVDLSRSGLGPAEAVAISVTDTGIGMTPDQQKIIFEAFQQADGSTSRQYGGTGLGLSISRELAAKLGGQIGVESEVGRGSTFTLYLPLGSKEDEADNKQAGVRPAEPDLEFRGNQKKVEIKPIPASDSLLLPAQFLPDDRAELTADDKTLLIIEDDPKFAKILYDFAHRKGFKCLIAGAGQTGLALVKEYKPEAIILDLNLPDLSGWHILEVLKNDPATRHIPVHIMSVEEEVLDAYRKGAIGYLTKPVSRADLEKPFEKIEQFISREIKTLLLVEDDANSRHSIKKLLEGSDVQISEAERGQAALDLLQSRHFDCIILDLSLPDMSGFEVLNKMNGQKGEARSPVIVYTGRDLTPEENLELMKYADSVIVKGVKSPERLLDETALFLHRVVADMPADKQQTIKQLYNHDGLLKDKKVLVVDDDVRNSFALSKLLSEKGMIVRIAQNGQKALDLLAKEPVDLVLMDIMMPVMDGFTAIERIRSQPQLAALPILALTAKAMKGDREKCLAVGANDYLAKPIDVDRLFSMLRVWLYQ